MGWVTIRALWEICHHWCRTCNQWVQFNLFPGQDAQTGFQFAKAVTSVSHLTITAHLQCSLPWTKQETLSETISQLLSSFSLSQEWALTTTYRALTTIFHQCNQLISSWICLGHKIAIILRKAYSRKGVSKDALKAWKVSVWTCSNQKSQWLTSSVDSLHFLQALKPWQWVKNQALKGRVPLLLADKSQKRSPKTSLPKSLPW